MPFCVVVVVIPATTRREIPGGSLAARTLCICRVRIRCEHLTRILFLLFLISLPLKTPPKHVGVQHINDKGRFRGQLSRG